MLLTCTTRMIGSKILLDDLNPITLSIPSTALSIFQVFTVPLEIMRQPISSRVLKELLILIFR